jgi:excisionase family DNA binding protein
MMNTTFPLHFEIESSGGHPPLALRPREAAKAIGVCERTLWEWTHHGDVPHLKVGGTMLYPVDALRDWLSRRAATVKGGDHDAS